MWDGAMGSLSITLSRHCVRGPRGIWFDGARLRDSGELSAHVQKWGLKHWPGEGEIGGTRGMVDHGIDPTSILLGAW